MEINNPVIIGDCTLYLGDCMDILPTLSKVDACITDPPYGINWGDKIKNHGDGFGGANKQGWKSHSAPEWDSERPKRATFDAILRQSDFQIIWGGNYFSDYLPPRQKWLVWLKCRGFTTSDFEMAWTSQDLACRLFDYHSGNEKGFAPKAYDNFTNVHPTQKPVGVMRWCIEQLPTTCKTILDPFMGSGTTGVACAKMGRKFIGIEREPEYFKIACHRIEEAYKQPDLFVEPPKKAHQDELGL